MPAGGSGSSGHPVLRPPKRAWGRPRPVLSTVSHRLGPHPGGRVECVPGDQSQQGAAAAAVASFLPLDRGSPSEGQLSQWARPLRSGVIQSPQAGLELSLVRGVLLGSALSLQRAGHEEVGLVDSPRLWRHRCTTQGRGSLGPGLPAGWSCRTGLAVLWPRALQAVCPPSGALPEAPASPGARRRSKGALLQPPISSSACAARRGGLQWSGADMVHGRGLPTGRLGAGVRAVWAGLVLPLQPGLCLSSSSVPQVFGESGIHLPTREPLGSPWKQQCSLRAASFLWNPKRQVRVAPSMGTGRPGYGWGASFRGTHQGSPPRSTLRRRPA